MIPVVVLGAATVSVLVGTVVLVRPAPRRIGWLLVAHGVCFGTVLIDEGTGTSRAATAADQLASGAWVFLFLWLVLVAYLVPDGHSASPGWRRFMLVGLAGVAAFLVGSAGDATGFREAHGGTDPPLTWLPTPVSAVLGVVGLLLTLMLFVGSVLAVRSRLRRSSGRARLQLLWLVWGATSLPLALALVWVGHFTLRDNPWVVSLAIALPGIAVPVSLKQTHWLPSHTPRQGTPLQHDTAPGPTWAGEQSPAPP